MFCNSNDKAEGGIKEDREQSEIWEKEEGGIMIEGKVEGGTVRRYISSMVRQGWFGKE